MIEATGFILRRRWLPVVVSAVAFVVGVLVGRLADDSAPLGYVLAWFGLVLGPVFYFRNAFPRATPTTIVATATGIALDGRPEIANHEILEAKVVPRHGVAVVELSLRDGTALALRTGVPQASALVAHLGSRRSRFTLIVPFVKRFLGAFLVLSAVGLLSSPVSALWMLPPNVFYALIVGWLVGLVRGRLLVGADGFTTRWLFRERFVPFREVDRVEGRAILGSGGVPYAVVVLRSGKRVRLRTVEAPNSEEERGAEGRAMVAHLKAAFERSAELVDGRADLASLVARGIRSPREWLAGIDALVRGGDSRYRVAAVSSSMLSDVANDPRAGAEARVGAAAAMLRLGEDELRTNVRVAAESCAETELRNTLLALAEARDDEAMEAALAAFRLREEPRRG